MNEAPKLTKKKVILIKLKNLQDKIKPYCKENEEIFPDVSTIDVIDFIFYFNFLFPDNSDYGEILKNIIESKDILLDKNNLDEVINLVLPFVEFLKKLK